MCGVVAVLAPSGGVERASVEHALDALSHRGPDGRGVWTDAGHTVALGHVRLAVRDREGGAQPLGNEEGDVIASVNGELYGIAALTRELTARGHRFRARTDSEIVVHAWEEWGPGMLSRLRGEFAFVLWDGRSRTLFAARDRFGVKPLVWAEHAGRLLLASQVRGLFALGLPRAWDHASLHQAVSLQYAPPDATLFAGAHALRAAHALLVEGGTRRIFEYADVACTPRAAVPHALDAHAPARFAEVLDEAVALRLESDVPYAFQLSGGIDSAAVLASATRSSGRALDAFTVSFTDGGAYDEVVRARETARHLGASLHVVPLSDHDVADAFPEAVLHAEGACVNAHAAAKLRLARAVRDAGFKVVLTGEGADEVLFGYAHLRSDLGGGDARLHASNDASAGLMLPDAAPASGREAGVLARRLGYVPTWVAAKASFGRRARSLARDEFLAGHAHVEPVDRLLEPFDLARLRGAGLGPVETSAYLWSKLALEGYILRSLGDGLEMAASIEGRLPFLDTAVVDHLRALPLEAKIRGGVEKWILRQAFRERLPEALVLREKHPFLAPPMGPRMLDAARDLVGSRAFDGQPLFEPSKVRALLDRARALPEAERKAYDPVFYFVVSIAVLHARQVVGGGASRTRGFA